MPYLKVMTNANLSAEVHTDFLKEASAETARALGKPEQYVMVSLEPSSAMVFAGTDAPTAYLELKSIGLPESQTKALSAALCALMEEKLSVPANRVYIEFADAPGKLWGFNGSTF